MIFIFIFLGDYHIYMSDFLTQTTTDCSEYPNIARDYRVINGYVQSGKTKSIIDISQIYLTSGISVVVIVRNCTEDVIQFTNRFTSLSNFPIGRPTAFKLSNVLNGNNPSVVVALRNVSDLDKITKIRTFKKYVCIIDESDLLDSNSSAQVQEFVNCIKDESLCTWFITATPFNNILTQTIKHSLFFQLPKPEFYKGVEDIEFIQLTEPARFSARDGDDLASLDFNLWDYIAGFMGKSKPCSKHPNITLIKSSACIKPYQTVISDIHDSFDHVITIAYNSEIVVRRNGGKNVSYYTSISDVLEKLQTNFPKAKHIFIFSGKLADRGISFSSNKYIEGTNLRWHLTEQYLITSVKISQSHLLQYCRLLGIFKDNIKLIMYTNSSIEIQKTHVSQIKILDDSKDGVSSDMSVDVKKAYHECETLPDNPLTPQIRVVERIVAGDIVVENFEKVVKSYNTHPNALVHRIIDFMISVNNKRVELSELKTGVNNDKLNISAYKKYGNHNYYKILDCNKIAGVKYYTLTEKVFDYFKNR